MSYLPASPLSLNELAEKYDLDGVTILNVMHRATLKAASREDDCIRYSDAIDAIRRECRK